MTQYPSPQDRPYGSYGQGYGPALGHGVDPHAPYGREPATGLPFSDKSKIAAGLLQIFLGTLGIGRFYMGSTGIAVAQLVLTVVGWLTLLLGIGFLLVFGVGVWALVDGIVILAGRPLDPHGRPLRA